jgi:hypothetical protein
MNLIYLITTVTNGIRPYYVLLDGHQSRFDVEFLMYVNDDGHMWSIVIGGLYGAALWQEEDLFQQKKRLFNEKKR